MKKTFITLSFLSMTFLAFCFCKPNTGDDDITKTIIKYVRQTLSILHYQPAKIDDKFSEDVYKRYFDYIDPSKRFFVGSDIALFKKDYHKLDDYYNDSNLSFYHSTIDSLYKRIDEAEKYSQEILAKPMDFTANEDYIINDSLRDYAKDKKAAKENWRKYLKYNVLLELTDLKEDSVNKNTPVKELEVKARDEVKDFTSEYFRRLKQRKKSTFLSIYINSFTEQYDPHTNYFSPTDKEDFDVTMSGQLEGIGAKLQDKKGYATITELVVGGPAWKSGKVEVGDQIVKVKQGKSGDAVNIVGMLLDEAIRLIRGKKGTEVILTLKKSDGTTHDISIIRDVIEYDETFARSAIITDEKGDKYGIVYLPEFYTDMNNQNGRDPSVDIAKEIELLKKENIKGLVFDIRDNGGGSLEEVVEIAGLFIKSGPIVQVRRNDGKLKILEDTDPTIAYDGPMVIMVNELSASASEIMAAALQDYKRAVIVGSNRTYGKGTVQTILPLDSKTYSTDTYGAIKLTIQKFYRINGGSTQLKGVSSDVVIPDQYSYINYHEGAKPEALPWDQITPLKFNAWQNPFDIIKVKANSEKRLSANPLFKLLDESARYYEQIEKTKTVSLNLDKFVADRKNREKELEKFKVFDKYSNHLSFANNSRDAALVKTDSTLLTRRNNWYKNLGKDFYLEESIQVLKDINKK